jgi:flagellar motor switch protein FliG
MLLKQMPSETVEAVTRELASLGRVPPELSASVVEEFYTLSMANFYADEGNLDYAKSILKESMDPKLAERVLAADPDAGAEDAVQLPAAGREREPADVHPGRAPADDRADCVPSAVPQGSEIMGGLPMQKQIEVIKRIANMEQTNPEVIRKLSAGWKAGWRAC